MLSNSCQWSISGKCFEGILWHFSISSKFWPPYTLPCNPKFIVKQNYSHNTDTCKAFLLLPKNVISVSANNHFTKWLFIIIIKGFFCLCFGFLACCVIVFEVFKVLFKLKHDFICINSAVCRYCLKLYVSVYILEIISTVLVV